MRLGTQVPPSSGPGGRWGRRPSSGEGAQEQGALLPRQDIGTRRCPPRRPPCSPLGTSCSWPHWPVRWQNQASGSGIECSEGSAAPQVAVRVQGTRRERGSAGGIRTQPRPPLASAGRPPPGNGTPTAKAPTGAQAPPGAAARATQARLTLGSWDDWLVSSRAGSLVGQRQGLTRSVPAQEPSSGGGAGAASPPPPGTSCRPHRGASPQHLQARGFRTEMRCVRLWQFFATPRGGRTASCSPAGGTDQCPAGLPRGRRRPWGPTAPRAQSNWGLPRDLRGQQSSGAGKSTLQQDTLTSDLQAPCASQSTF